MSLRALFLLHDGLPREAPGSDATTREALRRLGPLPPRPRILDLGCGPGPATLALARATDGEIDAVDLHAPFVARVAAAAAALGLADRVHARCADFAALDVPPASVDLIWCEGAAYHLGLGEALRRWRPLLRPGGRVALTELAWLVSPDARPAEAAAFWAAAYPAMTDIAGDLAAIAAAGFAEVDRFVLPDAAWDAYYDPLTARMEDLRASARTDPELAAVLADTAREVDLRRRFGASYGYVFHLLRLA